MNLSDVPLIQAALKDVLPIIPSIWRGFDEATTMARSTLDGFHLAVGGSIADLDENVDTHSRVYDPYLFPHLVRYLEKLTLVGCGLSVEEIQADDLAMSGLRLRCSKRVVHIRKATPDGGIPAPGKSQPTRAYYQSILFEECVGSGVDLLLLWHATQFGMFKGLSLVCVIPGKNSLEKRMLGIIQIPDPIETNLYLDAQQDQQNAQINTEVLGDLPIELLTDEDEDEVGQRDNAEQAE